MGKTLSDVEADWPVDQFDLELAEKLCTEWNANPPAHQNWRLFLRENVPVKKVRISNFPTFHPDDSPNVFTYFREWGRRIIRKADPFT